MVLKRNEYRIPMWYYVLPGTAKWVVTGSFRSEPEALPLSSFIHMSRSNGDEAPRWCVWVPSADLSCMKLNEVSALRFLSFALSARRASESPFVHAVKW